MKRVIACVIVFIMLFSLLPAAVFAEGVTSYGIWVGDAEVTENCLSGEGWSYQPASNTLTLDGFNYTGKGHHDEDNNYAPIYSAHADGLTLDLKGTSTVEETGDSRAWTTAGVCCIAGTLTITGGGTLNATGSGGAYTNGIFSEDDIVINGGTVNGIGKDVTVDDNNSYGIYSNGNLTINGGTVSGTGGAAPNGWSVGVYAPEGLVLGVGAKLFTIAGPVLVYGIMSSVIVGLISLLF